MCACMYTDTHNSVCVYLRKKKRQQEELQPSASKRNKIALIETGYDDENKNYNTITEHFLREF